ncbi:MAG TPA: ABC transporter permease [Fibrobacteraceae bacterium]|nr:ABC transporter permease [Fibrobacteraceae bacterium]
MRRFLALFRKEWTQVRRDSFSLKLLLVLPIVQSLVLGYALTRDVHNIQLVVVDQDHTPASAALIERVEGNRRFTPLGHLKTVQQVEQRLLQGKALLALVIPQGFANDLQDALPDDAGKQSHNPARVQLLVDGQDAATAATAVGYASAILAQYGTEELAQGLDAQGFDIRNQQPLDLRDRLAFNPDLDYAWYMTPGLIILLVTMVTALLTSFSLVREREAGTLEQLLVTPVRPMQILLGKALPYWFLAQVVFVLALVVVGVWFGLPLRTAPWGGLLLGCVVYALTCVSLGIFVSTLVSSQQQALFLIWFCLIFFILTSGFLLPLESMPGWMQQITEINSVRHFLFLVRSLLLRHASAFSLVPEYAKLSLISVVLFLASVLRFRRQV